MLDLSLQSMHVENKMLHVVKTNSLCKLDSIADESVGNLMNNFFRNSTSATCLSGVIKSKPVR